MDENLPNASLEGEIHYCAVHNDRDTELRCNRCDRYMCIDCAKRTPIGYTCRECVRGHENKFFAGTTLDYTLVGITSLGRRRDRRVCYYVAGWIPDTGHHHLAGRWAAARRRSPCN